MDLELNYEQIGKRLRIARQAAGYTQEYVAELAGISAQHTSGIECGSAKVSLPALVRICNALQITPDEILLDSIKQTTPLLLKNVESVFSDCSADEIFIMLTQAESLKKSLRARFTKKEGK